jgi:hypothetical protein
VVSDGFDDDWLSLLRGGLLAVMGLTKASCAVGSCGELCVGAPRGLMGSCGRFMCGELCPRAPHGQTVGSTEASARRRPHAWRAWWGIHVRRALAAGSAPLRREYQAGLCSVEASSISGGLNIARFGA